MCQVYQEKSRCARYILGMPSTEQVYQAVNRYTEYRAGMPDVYNWYARYRTGCNHDQTIYYGFALLANKVKLKEYERSQGSLSWVLVNLVKFDFM